MRQMQMRFGLTVIVVMLNASSAAAQICWFGNCQPYYEAAPSADWRSMSPDDGYRWIIAQAREFCRIHPAHSACRRPRARH